MTFPLGQELAKRIGPSEPAELYPRAVYAFIVEAAAKGAVRSELAAQLRSAQLSQESLDFGPGVDGVDGVDGIDPSYPD